MEVRAEQRAENRAMNDLARGDIRGYERARSFITDGAGLIDIRNGFGSLT